MRIPPFIPISLIAALISSACATTLSPGAARVKILPDGADVSACVAVGNLDTHPDVPGYTEPDARNLTVALGGNTLLVTYRSLGSLISGVAYRCPGEGGEPT